MVTKSEASMPMSRALAKLAVATDLGTAARPSTATPAPSQAGSKPGVLVSSGGIGASAGVGSSGKAGVVLAPGDRSRGAFQPAVARSALASLPLPLANLEQQRGNRVPGVIGPPPPPPAAVAAAADAASPAAAASGLQVAAPSTPRLPPLPIHSPSTQVAAATATMMLATTAPSASSQLPPATPPATQQWATPHQHVHHTTLSAPPLPPCGGVVHVSSSPCAGAVGSEFSKELRDAARNHPGLPASLVAQLYRPYRPGPPSSAPFAHASGPAASGLPSTGGSGGGSSGCVRPLSPRSRARLTASLVNGTAAGAAGPGVPSSAVAPPKLLLPTAPPPPPVSAMATMSPEALAVLLGTASQPPSTPGGLLVMRRAGPAAVGAGAALRPSTAQQGGTSGGEGGSVAATPAATAPGTASGPSRPPVMPHITVPYKPGSVRLPPGGVPGITAAVALRGPLSKGGSGPASAAGSGSGSPVVPVTAAAAAGASANEVLRPWTSAGGGLGSFRPVTANPLTHSMPMDSTTTLVVRMPRTATETSHVAPPMPPSRAGTGSHTAGRAAAAAGRPGAGPGLTAGVSSAGDGMQDGRQLTAQELRAVVAALAAARPEAAAILLPRPATAASGGDPQSRPVSGPGRRPTTSAVGSGGTAAEVTTQGPLWDTDYIYGRTDGKQPPGSAATRTSSRATTRGSLLSDSATSVGVRDPSVYDDKWPRPTSSRSRPGSRGATTAGSAAAAPPSATSGGDELGGGGSSRGGSSDGRRLAVTAWASTRRQLRSIPEDGELPEGEDAHGGSGGGGGAAPDTAAGDITDALLPLESLDSDPELDAAWVAIVAANQRPDTTASRSPSRGINVFSRPVTGAIHVIRQAAPMVLVLEDITASTPEVLERELESLSLEELHALRAKLCT